ncbi:hypothetical protein [Phenylobacterium sp.]|uniref:hypothetical protein n=1 Tax=Phenylobacterium sp. TaxID=1871053 RepID=UPI0025CD72C8|nr:hypothetical protein [Phenylobacterium sp.]
MAIDYGVSSYVCTPRDTPRLDAPGAGEHEFLLAINLTCLAVALLGLAAAFAGSRAASEEGSGAPRGRHRFLAVSGLLASAIFVVAILFNTPSAVAVRLCWSAPA